MAIASCAKVFGAAVKPGLNTTGKSRADFGVGSASRRSVHRHHARVFGLTPCARAVDAIVPPRSTSATTCLQNARVRRFTVTRAASRRARDRARRRSKYGYVAERRPDHPRDLGSAILGVGTNRRDGPPPSLRVPDEVRVHQLPGVAVSLDLSGHEHDVTVLLRQCRFAGAWGHLIVIFAGSWGHPFRSIMGPPAREA